MTDRPASRRMPTPREMKKLAAAAAVGTNAPTGRPVGPGDDMPPEYWDAVLRDISADEGPPGPSIRTQRISEISRHLLRVSCRRCGRTVEIQKVDAVRLYTEQAIWKDVALRLLDGTCTRHTGRYEEDGCWPRFE
jgi:hypothetical protein